MTWQAYLLARRPQPSNKHIIILPKYSSLKYPVQLASSSPSHSLSILIPSLLPLTVCQYIYTDINTSHPCRKEAVVQHSRRMSHGGHPLPENPSPKSTIPLFFASPKPLLPIMLSPSWRFLPLFILVYLFYSFITGFNVLSFVLGKIWYLQHPNPIGDGLATEAIVEAAGPDCIVPGQVTPVRLLGLKVLPSSFSLLHAFDREPSPFFSMLMEGRR